VSLKDVREKAQIAKGIDFSNSIQNALGVDAVGVWSFVTLEMGNKVHDSSGYGNHGTVFGGTVPIAGIEQLGNALQFDGVDDYIDCGSGASLENLTAKSFFLWIKPTAYMGSYRYIYDGSYWAGTHGDMAILWNNANNLIFYLQNTAGDAIGRTISYIPDQWTYVGYSWDGVTITSYKNGESQGSSSFTGTLASSARNLTFGKPGDGYLNFTGLMDEVRIYATALTSAQIKSQYYAGLDSLLSEGLIDNEEYRQILARN
jgi:hypothetical protein